MHFFINIFCSRSLIKCFCSFYHVSVFISLIFFLCLLCETYLKDMSPTIYCLFTLFSSIFIKNKIKYIETSFQMQWVTVSGKLCRGRIHSAVTGTTPASADGGIQSVCGFNLNSHSDMDAFQQLGV